jgi:protein-disulfide isomerase
MRAVFILLGLIVAGIAGYFVYTSMPAAEPPVEVASTPSLDEAAVRAIVAEMIAAREAELTAKGPMNTAEIDPTILNPMIEDYLMGDPRILQRLSNKLEEEIRVAEAAAAKEAIATMQDAIFNDPDHVVLGNPMGDVTLVEMFDYNCGYCRGALPDLATLLAEDPNLKVILKEFPILSRDSVEAARVAVLVSKEPVDYWTFHQTLFSGRGAVTAQTALDAAKSLGLNPVELQLEMESEAVTKVIQKSYDIAKALNVNGTPTYIIGDEIIPGAIGIDELRLRIANMRECGATFCAAPLNEAAPVVEEPGMTAPRMMDQGPTAPETMVPAPTMGMAPA